MIKQGERGLRVTNISEAKASLSKLVEKVLQGEEVVISKAGKPVAKLVPYNHKSSPRDLDLSSKYRETTKKGYSAIALRHFPSPLNMPWRSSSDPLITKILLIACSSLRLKLKALP
jgi:prevent-host-death family protein